jgi:phosphomevalonate kinase
MKVVGLIGKKNVGKDTIADIMTRHLRFKGYKVATTALAVPLKSEVADMLGISLTELEESKNTNKLYKNKTIREWLQHIGEENCKTNKKYYVNRLGESLLYYKNIGMDFVIVTDVRKIIEAEYLKEKWSSVNIKIIRDTGLNDSHNTETEVNKIPDYLIDYTCYNTEYDSLYHKVEDCLIGLGLLDEFWYVGASDD